MKYLDLSIFFCLTVLSCSFHTSGNSNLVELSNPKDELISQIDSNKIEINANFPFGCVELIKFKYPKHWEGDLENYGHHKKNKLHEFENIEQCFKAINLAKTIQSPKPQNIELIDIGHNFKNAFNLDTILQRSIDSCKYRLPNIGIYECYYSYAHYGNLLLLDPKTNIGKLLNIYANDLGGETLTVMRYFYLDKNEIRIYEANYYDDGCTLNEIFKIIVNSTGEIKINQIYKR